MNYIEMAEAAVNDAQHAVKLGQYERAEALTRIANSYIELQHAKPVPDPYPTNWLEPMFVDFVSELVHEAWMKAKLAEGVTSRILDTTGEELMVPYIELSEEAKELDRVTVRTVLTAVGEYLA